MRHQFFQSIFFRWGMIGVLLVIALVLYNTTPKNKEPVITQDTLLEKLTHADQQGGAQALGNLIHTTSFSTPQDLSQTLKFLQDRHVQSDMNPQYGFLYADILRRAVSPLKDSKPQDYTSAVATSVLTFYASALMVESQIARCADPTAGQTAQKRLHDMYEQYRPLYNTLPQELQEHILKTLPHSMNMALRQPPQASICKDGQQYMRNVLASKDYTETHKTTSENGAATITVIESDHAPEYIKNADWHEIVQKIYTAKIASLSHDTSAQ